VLVNFDPYIKFLLTYKGENPYLLTICKSFSTNNKAEKPKGGIAPMKQTGLKCK